MPNLMKRFEFTGTLRRTIVGLVSAIGIGLAISVTLVGCAPASNSDPLVAMTVNGTPVPLSAYQQVLAVFTANAALQADSSASAIGWNSPIDRGMVTSSRKQTIQFFANLFMLQAQMKQQHLTVSQSNIDVATKALQATVMSLKAQLSQTTGNARLRQLINAVTPDAIHWLALQGATYNTFVDKGKVPAAHTYGILVNSKSDSEALIKNLNAGADFTTLAKTHSLDSTATSGGNLGTIWVGQISPQFDSQVFVSKKIPAFFAIPVTNAYGVFEVVGGVNLTALNTVGDQATEQNYLNAWLNEVLAPHAVVHVYADA